MNVIFRDRRPSGWAGKPQNIHGAAGTVIDVSESGLAVRDNDNDEQSIIMASDTVIKKMDTTIPLDNVAVGDHVVVIGAPNSSGQVEARFIRVFPSPGPGDGSPQPQHNKISNFQFNEFTMKFFIEN